MPKVYTAKPYTVGSIYVREDGTWSIHFVDHTDQVVLKAEPRDLPDNDDAKCILISRPNGTVLVDSSKAPNGQVVILEQPVELQSALGFVGHFAELVQQLAYETANFNENIANDYALCHGWLVKHGWSGVELENYALAASQQVDTDRLEELMPSFVRAIEETRLEVARRLKMRAWLKDLAARNVPTAFFPRQCNCGVPHCTAQKMLDGIHNNDRGLVAALVDQVDDETISILTDLLMP